MRPLYLIVGFWGDRFRSYFIDYCLPSLLSPRNLGILSAGDGHRFLICTTAADWLALQRSSSWNLLLTHATPVHIEVGFPDDSSEESKFRHMTYGHRLLVNEAYRDRALACQIMPDAMYTDGTIETVLRHAAEGAHAVLTVALRLKEEGLFVGLHNQKLAPEYVSAQSARHPIILKSQSVVDLVVANLYDDSLLHDWDGSHFPRWPAYSFWRVPGQAGILIHSAYYAYILLDMAVIGQHNERSFEIASIENYWLSDNFPDPGLVHIVRDSDDAMVVSWTPSASYVLPPTMSSVFRLPGLSAIWKGYRLRSMRDFHLAIGDIQKANNVRYPIRLHSGEINDEWCRVEARAQRIMTWFFGDVFDEYSGKTRLLPTRIVLAFWWPLLRAFVRLGLHGQTWRRKLKDSRVDRLLKIIMDSLRRLSTFIRAGH